MLVDFECKCSRVKIILLQDMMGHGSPWLQRGVDSNILQRSSQLSATSSDVLKGRFER